jgi:transcriptional regulator with XRE-family HTH domain
MLDYLPYSDQEIGARVASIRESARLTQAELAKIVDSSPTVLSRIESGERAATQVELERICRAVGSAEAQLLFRRLSRNWTQISAPPLDHPDQELLWDSEEVLHRLLRLMDEKPLTEPFRNRIHAYVDDLKKWSLEVTNREFQIALIGSIGIGKSTALCRLAGLELTSSSAKEIEPVLEAGAGGITVCEVHLRQGQGYGISIDPCELDEIREHVAEFAEYFIQKTADLDSLLDSKDSQGISEELKRSIRNMSGLRIRKVKAADGRTQRIDDAKELAGEKETPRDYMVEVLSRMGLHRRDRRDIWFDPVSDRNPLEWLRDTFVLINNGRHPEFTIPRRIEVTVPFKLVDADDLTLRFVDTKGVDQIAARPDLERFFGLSHTAVLLCSRFNDAPSGDAKLLLQRAQAAGNRDLSTNAAILILPHSQEAMAVKDDTGFRVESIAEGYELKREQVQGFLQSQKLNDVGVGFFNAFEDSVESGHEFLKSMLRGIRLRHRSVLSRLVDDSSDLLSNVERAESNAVLSAATGQLLRGLENISVVGDLIGHIEESLYAQFTRAYAATVRATVRRSGEWNNLNYGHHLAFGARTVAVKTLGQKISEFMTFTEYLRNDPHYSGAQGLIDQARSILLQTYDDLLRKADLLGESLFKDDLKKDAAFWSRAENEWGRGWGYKDRVHKINEEWFSLEDHRVIEKALHSLLVDEWTKALSRVRSILEETA